MARCERCSKFVSKDTEQDPEITDGPTAQVAEGLLTVTLTARIHNDCADCGQEMEESSIEMEGRLDAADHTVDDHEFDVDESDVDLSRTDSGGGRYAKRMYGVEGQATVKCTCGGEFVVELKGDAVAASYMEDCQ